ncbi:hypothetical protein B296_00037882, partial [Ensete ventricosum]
AHGGQVWLDGEASTTYVHATQIPRLARDMYTLPSEVLMARAAKALVLYGYQLALARLRARHPGVEIEEDPFTLLPDDADVPMAEEQPFDNSPPPVEE